MQIETKEAIVFLPKESLKALNESGEQNDDIYFKLVPIKDEAKKEAISMNASKQAMVKIVSGNQSAEILGTPMNIETNMSGKAVDITLPLKDITLPSDVTKKQAFLNDLRVFIEHSDGEKVLEKGQVVEYSAGVYGIKFTVNKFSSFSIIKLN